MYQNFYYLFIYKIFSSFLILYEIKKIKMNLNNNIKKKFKNLL